MRAATLSRRASAVALSLLSPVACTLDFDQFATPSQTASATATMTGASSSTASAGGSVIGASSSSNAAGASSAGGAGGSGGTGGAAGAGSDTGSGGGAGDVGSDTGSGGGGDVGSGPGAGGSAGGGAIADASDARPSDAATDTVPPRDVITDPLDAGFNCASAQGLTYQGHCYFPSLGPYTWPVAATSCPFGAHLVTITSAGEQAIAAQILPTRDRWIGMRKDMNTPDVVASYFWVNNDSTAYSNWDLREGGTSVEPNFSGDCVRMQFNSFWADDVCTSAYPALCERE